MPYSKRLPLSRGYLIVRGRRCFQESFFWPIKVAMKSGIRHRNLPLPLGQSYYRRLLIVRLILPSLLYPRCWSVESIQFLLLARLGRMYKSEGASVSCNFFICADVMYFRIEMPWSSVSQPFVMYLAILSRYKIPGQRGRERSFTYSVVEALSTSEIKGWFYSISIK